jgi:hypothetical protein
MDAGIRAERGETAAHRQLKRLSVLWAQAQGYSACALEVSLPRCRYRADVAAFRPMRGELGWTAIFAEASTWLHRRRIVRWWLSVAVAVVAVLGATFVFWID